MAYHRKIKKHKKKMQLLLTVAMLAFIFPQQVNAEVKTWQLNAIAPTTTLVNVQENLDWRLMAKQEIKKNDCIRFFFENPYEKDAPETYKSFNMNEPYNKPCDFSTSHKGECSTIDSKTFQILFTKDNPNMKITGQTVGEPFLNPYSSRRFSKVSTTYYENCDLASEPKIAGDTTIAAFQQAVILENDVSLVSSSQRLAVTGAVLTVTFTPQSLLPKTGQISVQVPAWYTISEVNLPKELSSESMCGFDSEASMISHEGEGFDVLRTTFDASSRQIVFQYMGTRVILNDEEVVFTITSFKNPVNKDQKRGFRITTQDSQGYLVDQSEAELMLATVMTIHGELVGKELLMLGDSEGKNIGRIYEYNKLYFFLSSYIPFEQFCYFKFVFPKKLQIDEAMTLVSGDGIFAPTAEGSGLLPSTFIKVDLEKNTIYVEGCKQPYSLSSRPFGVVTFQYVLLPDYVTDTDPIELYAYSDNAYTKLVFEESKASAGGLSVTREMLQPGQLDLVEFSPSDYYAYVKDVQYTVSIRPSHDMLPSTRIVLTMPENLKFDQAKGCTVTYTEADCMLDAVKNELILTKVFKERTPGGTILKFIIHSGDNPIGARNAGAWGARTEGFFGGNYFIVDGETGGESFYAQPGYLKSTLDYKAEMTYSTDSELDFAFETEHDVPKNGFIKLILPIEMAFPDQTVQDQNPEATIGQTVKQGPQASVQAQMEFVKLTPEYILMIFPDGHKVDQNPIRLTLTNILTPRSFRPSSEFVIQTLSVEEYIIDAGGSDIQIVMSVMNTLNSFEITPVKLINGAITDYLVRIQTFIPLKNRDRILITTPPTVTFGPNISCDPIKPKAIGVGAVSCEIVDDISFAINLDKMTINDKMNKKNGIFEIIVHGMKNPPNFRKSEVFSNIYIQTFDYYNICALESHENLWIQTDEVGTITEYNRDQSTEIFGLEAVYTINFTPINPISKDGIITLEWSDQVKFNKNDDLACKVQTYQAFNQECVIDFENKTIKIYNVFKGDDQYLSPIQIILEKITNPVTNLDLIPFVIKTFDDFNEEYPIDRLEYVPLTQCNFPCKRCATDKDYCYSCWKDLDETFLMATEVAATCKQSCDLGSTTNGNKDKICQSCDVTCNTCQDRGDEGDKSRCKECAEGYNFRFGQECVSQCPIGTFISGDRCLECDSQCKSCTGSADFCTTCSPQGSFNFLFGNKCLNDCPSGMGKNAGVCFDCEFPCSQCSTAPKICKTCSQDDGLAFLYGPNCVDTCPIGFKLNEKEKKCEGCGSGCEVCDVNDQRICLQCESPLMMYEATCVSDCPSGWLSNLGSNQCYPLTDLDISLIPFPSLIISVIFFFLSYVGDKQKKKHLLIPNWLVLMGILEHGILLSQIILTFKYGTFKYVIFIMIAWLCFVATNIVFWVLHYRRITLKDGRYNNWRNRPKHIWARRLMNVTGIIGNWKGYKLSYSSFYGLKLTPATFKYPEVYRDLQKRFLWINILSVYAVVIVLNCYGLYDLDWGTQLYIQMIENIVIFLMIIWASLWEQKKQETDYLADRKFSYLNGNGKLNVMSALDEQDMAGCSNTKEHLLGVADPSKMYVERKFDELVKLFGDRKCKSFYDLNREGEEDPRIVLTWPCSPSIEIRGPIEPLPDPHPDNCYTQGYNNDQMFQMKFLSKGALPSKGIQSDAFDADMSLRRDAFLVGHQEMLIEPTHTQKKKQSRGRKNRFFQQIDNEDNETGLLLDDVGGQTTRRPMNVEANELLDPQSPRLTAVRKQENKKLLQQETLNKAMLLTEENLRLKRVLEDQRQIDIRDQEDFQSKILEEEKRRHEILANIEKTRGEREVRKNEVKNSLQQEKDVRMGEIEKMKEQHMKKNANLPPGERAAAEAQFENEKARLESEFNEKILKTQREAAPSTKLASPVKYNSSNSIDEADPMQKSVRLVPQGVASKIPHSIGTADPKMKSLSLEPQGVASKIPNSSGITDPKQKSLRLEPQGVASKISHDISGNPLQNSIRLVPQGVAIDIPPHSGETSFREDETSQLLMDNSVDTVSAKKSQTGTSANDGILSSQPGNTHRMSMLQTADEASLGENSIMEPIDFDCDDFNEIDILGTLDRDDKGNVIVPVDESGKKRAFDQEGRPINHHGYLINQQTGDIFHNTTLAKVFSRRDLDERGNIPMPYALEKYNFNPFDLLGTFFYEDPEDPLSFNKGQRGNRFIDELGRFVSMQGFLVNEEGSVIDKDGVKRFDYRQFKTFGGLMPKLFNYYGKTFELQEIMGVFDRDNSGQIQLMLGKDEQGQDVYVDKAGFMVNQKGYIVTRDGHICTREGKVLFLKKQLRKGGQIPKIFPFTRFNINRILGEVEMDPGGQPILIKNDRGQTVDKQGRLCNAKGYLVDRKGNVIDLKGKVVFQKPLLELTGEIPEIFHSNILRSDSASSLSRFMSDIDRDQRFDASGVTAGMMNERHAGASDTSFESMMEDSPSRYDSQNQRFNQTQPDQIGYGTGGNGAKSARWAGNQLPGDIMEEMSEYEAGEAPLHKRKRKRVKARGEKYVLEQVTGRDVAMASAYGGVAKPKLRKIGTKFTTGPPGNRAGLQTSQGTERPPQPRIQNLTDQVKTWEQQDLSAASKQKKATNRGDMTTQRTGPTADVAGSRAQNATTGWREQHENDAFLADESQEENNDLAAMVRNMRNKRDVAKNQRKNVGKAKADGKLPSPRDNIKAPAKTDRAYEEEFEKIYRKDIDKFIDGSDFEVESLAGFSELSKGTLKSATKDNQRMKGLEKVYLQRLEFQQLGQKVKKTYRPKPPKHREFMDRFTDDHKYIAKGEQLKFEIGNTTHTGSSGKKQQLPGNPYMEINQQRSQSSLIGAEGGMVNTTSPFQRPVQTPQNLNIGHQDSVYSGQIQNSPRQQPSTLRQNLR